MSISQVVKPKKISNFSLARNFSNGLRDEIDLFAPDAERERDFINKKLTHFEKYCLYKFDNFGRDALREFLETTYSVKVSELTVIEGIHYCRGSQMERSSTFDREKLLGWLVVQIPILLESQAIQEYQRAELKEKISKPSVEPPDDIDVDEVVRSAQYNKKSRGKLLELFQKIEDNLNEERSK